MKIRTGIDIIEVERIHQSVANSGPHFTERIYTKSEIEYCSSAANKYERFAARFAAKEAFVKALGTGFTGGIVHTMVEIDKDNNGKPILKLHGRAQEELKKLKVISIDLSISHVRDTAAASVTILSRK
ncbi:MAG: holo-ACP synthase [Clostridia bacterium]|nr:holo-ACP synthase [Clostridia bacterium]